jgi:hypothetical protein
LVLIDHFLFFRHFSSISAPRSNTYNRFSIHQTSHSEIDIPSFGQIAAFFGICVWLVPFGLFVSLSAGELVLPTIDSTGAVAPGDKRRSQGLLKQVYYVVKKWFDETMQALGWSRGRGYNDYSGFGR